MLAGTAAMAQQPQTPVQKTKTTTTTAPMPQAKHHLAQADAKPAHAKAGDADKAKEAKGATEMKDAKATKPGMKASVKNKALRTETPRPEPHKPAAK